MSTMANNDPIPIDDQGMFFRQIVDSSPALLHTARPDGYLDFFNQGWLNFIGQPLERLLGWQWTSFIHPEDVEAFVQKWRESIATGESFEGTARVRRADGEYRWMLHHKLAMRSEGGKIIKWHGSSVDIDGQKRAEEQLLESAQELHRSEAYLAEAQRLSHTGSFGWKPGSEEHVWSDETYRIFEYSSRDKVTLDMIVERVHPEDRNFVVETVERASISGGAIDYEYRLLFPDDRVKNVHVLARPLENNSDDLEFAGAVIDTTEAKRAEEKIRLSEKELQILVEAIPAYVGTNLPDGSLDFISQSWLDYTGLSREQWVGWGWVSTMHPDDVDRVVANWRAALATGAPVEYQLRCRGADGIYHWFLYRGVPFCDEGGKVVKWYSTVTNIDVLKQTESALQTREQQLIGIIETIPSMLWSASPTGETTHLSQRCLEYCGVPLEELVNRGWESFIHPDDLVETVTAYARAIGSGESFRAIHRLRRADGEYRWHHAMGEPLRDPRGTIIQWYGLTIDIDERKRAEETLRNSESELRTLIDVLPAYVGTCLPDGTADFLSQSWLEYSGQTREEAIAWGWAGALHPDDADRVLANWRAGLDSGEPVEMEFRCRRADGTYRWFLDRNLPLRNDEGKIVKWYGILFDIDALKKTESALKMREHELLSIIETIPSNLWSLWPNGEPSHLSKRFLDYFGVPFEEFLNWGWVRIIHPDDQEETGKAFARALETGGLFNVINRWRRADGVYRWHHTMGEPLRDPQGKIIQWYGLSVDIDDRKRAEETLRKSERELRTLIDVMPAYVGTALPDGTADFFSQRWLDYFGQTREEAMGWGWAHVIHPDDVDRVSANWREGLASGEPVEQEMRCRRADGVYRWFLNRNLPLRDDEGKIVKWYGILFDIDVLKKTESALQMREHELLGIIETIPSMLVSISPTGELKQFSQRTVEYFGASLEEFVKDGWGKFIHPDDLEETAKVFFPAIEAGEPYNLLYRLRRADGEYRWHQTRGAPLRDADGKVIQYYGLAEDIDDRKRAEDTLRKNERELRTLIDVMPAIVGISSPDGKLGFLSQSWLDYFGQTTEEALGGGWASVIHPDDIDRVLANRQAGLAAGEPVEQELRCRRADGVYHWFLNRSLPLRDNEGKIVKWYGFLFEIDVLKRTESALQMREHELLGIIETIPSMLWSASPTGEATHLSQRFIEYFGVCFEEIINRGWETFIHPDDREETVKAFARAINSGESYSAIQRLRRADGEYRWHHSMGEPLRDPHGKIIQYYGLTMDIDDRKRAEDHLRDTGIKLAKASRLTTVAELAGSIAHELNQPLTSILANAQAAKRWLNVNPSNVAEVNSSIERTIRDARAADETMQHIRALFKQESFVKKDVRIPDILNEVVRIVQEDPKRRAVPVECQSDESLPAVPVDQIQIQQVFINLIVNAIEALEGQQEPPLVTLRATVTDSDTMLIQVIDNGPGVDDPDRIFDAFMTTKEKGMGIGLAVSRSIVEAHGGRLWAENNEPGGAIFNVALPLSHASPATAQIQEYA
jgi:PAS domain S-box-containing protein